MQNLERQLAIAFVMLFSWQFLNGEMLNWFTMTPDTWSMSMICLRLSKVKTMPKRPAVRRTTADVARMIDDDLTATDVIDRAIVDATDTFGISDLPVRVPLDLSPGQLRFRDDQKLIPPLPDAGPLCPCCGRPCTDAEYHAYGRHEDCAVSGWGPGKSRPGESKVIE